MNSTSIRETSAFVEARRTLLAGSARAPTHERTRTPGSRAVRRRTREVSRIAPQQPGKARRRPTRAAAPQAPPSPRCGSESGTDARNRVSRVERVVRPPRHRQIRHAPRRLPGHAYRQTGACDAAHHYPTTQWRAPSRCRVQGCSGASARPGAKFACTPPGRGRQGRTRAVPRSKG